MPGRPRRDCELEPYVDGFRDRLLSVGYTPGTVANQLAVVGRFGRWLAVRGRPVDRLRPADIDRFIVDQCRDGRRHGVFRQGLVLLREHLIEVRALPADQPSVRDAVDELVDSYCAWLLSERGLAATTVRRYRSTARRFLDQRAGGVNLNDLTAAEVSAFLLAISAHGSVGAAKGHVAEIRSLLRYSFVTGRTPVALAAAVPPVAGWHDTGIPPRLSTDTIRALLDSCSRSTPVGIRDLAIMLLLARLGLRSIEVARLQLQDVHWRIGEITVRGKARRLDRLPLPADVGEALAAYVMQARPRCELREVFLTCRAPRRAITADVVGDLVQQACIRVSVPAVGPHRLRHALATEMVSRGVALTDISQVLRHRDLATTAIYANPRELHQMGEPNAFFRSWRSDSRRGSAGQGGVRACRVDRTIPSDAGYAHHLTMGVALRRMGLAGAASVELVDGVVQLRPQEAMVEAMLRGWRPLGHSRTVRHPQLRRSSPP